MSLLAAQRLETREGLPLDNERSGTSSGAAGQPRHQPRTPSSPHAGERPRLGARSAFALALLSGLLYFAAFPGLDLWPLTFVAFVPLLVALEGQTPRRSLLLGLTAGFTMNVLGFYWLLGMLQEFSGFPTALCGLFMVLLCGYQGGRVALLGWLHGRIVGKGWPEAAAFSLAFIASELAFPLLFPWYYAGTLHLVPVLLQLAEIGGPILVGLTLVATNLLATELLRAARSRQLPRPKLWLTLAALPAFSLLYGLVRIPQVDASVSAAPKARLGVVQANMSLMAKRRDRVEGLRRHLDLTGSLQAEAPLDGVIWAETSVAGAVGEAQSEAFYRQLFTRRLGIPAIFGAVLLRPVQDVRRYVLFNSALASDASGDIVGRYDKQFLMMFGEYLPLGEQFPVLYEWSPNSGKFTPGTSLDAVPFAGHRAGVLICYEDILPSFVNQIVNRDAPELLVNMTNDAWFGDTTEPWIHFALSKLRAIEQRRFLVRANNSGISGFVDPVGRDLGHTETFVATAMAREVAWLNSSPPFRYLGQAPWWLATTLAGWLAFRRRRAVSRQPAS